MLEGAGMVVVAGAAGVSDRWSGGARWRWRRLMRRVFTSTLISYIFVTIHIKIWPV